MAMKENENGKWTEATPLPHKEKENIYHRYRCVCGARFFRWRNAIRHNKTKH